ncbi:uncharacterized protein LOC122024280 isoform X1 [Zingiber officinale]|uniref:uncharacterized protein LOC122024280 isoform X1 n=1 Tax=Zingiber officinale TaxID=94328 RepID=UPI001C4AEB7D|nr:uncharacterized protein LOC122024280 isoform X1 [Zingiber officinale]
MEVDYESKPRRELQALCKQHGLPANLTNARMAENLASLLQKANSEEIKPKGCLKGSGGSSAEEGGGRLLPKKVSFSLHEVGVRALPERRRSSRRKSVVGFAPKEVTEGALEAKIELEVRKTSKRYHCTSPDRNGEDDLATNFPCPGGIPLDEKHDGAVPITRNLRSRVITVEGSKALQADIKVPRRIVTRSNRKKAQVEVVASIPEVHSEEMKSRSDDGLVNKGRSKRQKCGNATVKIDERHDNFTKSQNLLNRQESGTSVAPVADETVAIKKIRKLGRNKKTNEATDVTDPSIEHTVVVPVTKSSVVHEPNKEIKRPNHNAPELQICVEKLVHITAKEKKLHNLQIGQVINEPPNEDSYVDCTVGDGRETHLGQKHVEELQRKSRCTRSGLVLEANKNDGRLRAKKRTKSSCLDDDSFSRGKVEVTSRSDSTDLLDEKGSSCRHEDVSEQTVEVIDSHIDQGPFHPCLSLFVTEDIPTINAHNSFFGEEQPIHKHENSSKKTAANELKVAEEKIFLTKEVEPVGFDLLDTKKMDSNVGFSCSSQGIPSADWSVKNVTLEGGSSHSGLDSTNKVKDRQGSQGFVGESAFKRTYDNQMLVRGDNDFLSNNSIDVSIKLKDGSSYSEEVMKEDSTVLETECMSNTIYSKDQKDGDGLNMCLNIRDAPFICHREEHSHVSATHTCSLNQPKTITLQVNGDGVQENTSNTSSCDSDLKDKAVLPLTVFACNDLVDFFDQPKISRNSIGSYGVASMASSSAAYEEFCGLKDVNDTNVPCDSLHAYEVVKQEGILKYSSSNCEITANSVEHSQGEQRQSQESSTAVPDFQSCNIVQDDDRCVNKFGSCSRCVINCNFSEQAIDQRVLSPIRPEISSEIQKTPLEVKVINIPSSGDNLYKNHHDDNSCRVDLIKPSDHRELSGFRSYGRNSYSEGFGMQGGKSTSLPEKSGGAITVIFEQMKGLQFDVAKEVPSELKLFVDYEAQALLQDELNLEEQQVLRTGSSLSTVASPKSGMASDALLSDDERRHDGTKGVDLPSHSGFKDKRIAPAITEINDVLGSSCKDTFDHSPIHLAQSSGKFQGDIWATISTSNSVRKIEAVCNADSPCEEDNLEVINMEDHQPQMAVSPFCVVSSIEGNACFLNDEFKQPKHANSSESANAIEEDAPNKLPLSLSVPKDINILNNDDLSISRVEKKSEFLAPFSGGLKEVKEVAVIHDGVENSGLNASYGFSNCESKHAKSLSNGSALAIKFYMESVHNLDEVQNKFQASLDADSKITGIPVNEDFPGGLKGRKSYGTTASSVEYACCTNVDLPTDNVKDDENNLNGPSKILMEEVDSRMNEDNEEVEVTMRQETENWLDTSVHEEDAQECLPLKNESDNRSFELTASCKTIYSFERQCIEDHDEADIGHSPKNEHETVSNIDNTKTRGNLTSPTLTTVQSKLETSMPNLDNRNLLSSDAVDEGGEHLCTSPPVPKAPLVSVDKNSEILNICQVEPDLTRFEEAETDKDNADGCNVSPSTNEHYDGKVENSSSKSPKDGSSVQSSLNYSYQHSKTEEIRIAIDVPLMFSGDLFNVERTQSNDANNKSNQKKFFSDYSKGRSAATNMVGEIENTKNEQEEQTIDGTMDFEYLTRLEASTICSDSATVDELENQVTVPFDVESTPRKDTTIENEDNECIENTSKKYLATQHLVEAGNRNEKDIETPDMASSQNAHSRCVIEESESAIGIKDLFEDLSATTMSVSSPGGSAMGEVISESTNDTPKMTIGSFEIAFDACSALHELEPIGVLGTLGDTLIMPTEEVSSNSTNHFECEMKNAQEFSTEKKSNICLTINRSIEIEAQTSNIEIGSVAVSCEVKPVSSLGTPKDTPILPNEQENRDAGIPICPGAAVMFDQITKCKKDVAQENTAEDINLTSKTIITSSDVALEKLSTASTSGEEQLSTTEAEIVRVNNIILEEKCGDGGSKVQELLVETINMNKLSQPTQGIAPAYSSSEHSSFTNDDPTESPELTIEWEEEFSRKLLDFRVSSAIKTSEPAAMPGKENAPAIRKDLPQMHPVDGSAIKSSRKALKTINNN